jgi:hypothetical protein
MPEPTIRTVSTETLITDIRARVRERVDETRVELFAEMLADAIAGAKLNGGAWSSPFPALDVVADGRGGLILADGWHRLQAHRQVGAQHITVYEHRPEARDPVAVAYEIALARATVSALPLTEREKRAAIGRLAAERAELSDRAIGRLVGVSHHTVARWRAAPGNLPDESEARRPRRPPIEALARAIVSVAERVHALASNLDGDDESTFIDELQGHVANATGGDDWAISWLSWAVGELDQAG